MADSAKLSQAEIDALLNHQLSYTAPGADSETPILTSAEKDALGEIGNISFGSASTALSGLLQQRVDITTPQVTLMRANQISADFPRPYVMVQVEFTAGLQGTNMLAIELNDAKTIADLMLGGDGRNIAGDLNELHLSAVAEAMNQMMGAASTSMSTIFSKSINISPPSVEVVDLSVDSGMSHVPAEWLANVEFRIRVGDLLDSRIMQLIPLPFARDMVKALTQLLSDESQNPSQGVVHAAKPVEAATRNVIAESQRQVAPTMEAAVQTLERSSDRSTEPHEPPVLQTRVQHPDFTDFSAPPLVPGGASRNLSLLFDVALNVTVELGRTKRAIKDILDLAPGSVLELDKLAGEPVDILVNNKRIAMGEVVVIDESFGVRITDIISTEDRVRNLQ